MIAGTGRRARGEAGLCRAAHRAAGALWQRARGWIRGGGESGGRPDRQREFTTDKAIDFTAILTSIKAVKPDAIFFGGADARAGPMARQIKQRGVKAKFMGGEMLKSPNYLKLADNAAEGTIASLAARTDAGRHHVKPRLREKGDLKDGAITVYRLEGGEWRVMETAGGT